MRGSVLGVGTDIGGSIRIPALCCGNFGFKPSTDRIPFGGQVNPVPDGKILLPKMRDREAVTQKVLSVSKYTELFLHDSKETD